MDETKAERKEVQPDNVIDAKSFRRNLGEYLDRIGFGDQRFILRKNGKDRGALVPMKDLERLRELDAA